MNEVTGISNETLARVDDYGPAIADTWRSLAPELFASFERIEATAYGALDPEVVAPLRRMMLSILCADRHSRGDAAADSRVVALVDFAEQFVIDVAGITKESRAAMFGEAGRGALLFVQSVFVSDVFLRARVALDRLAATQGSVANAVRANSVQPDPIARTPDELWPLLEAFMRDVAQLQSLDALTTELIRLRGADVHRCRLCQSRLSVKALDQAGDIALFTQTRDFNAEEYRDADRAAMRLADALVTQPSSIDHALVDAAHRHFSHAQQLEIVFDVVRNAANKIAVAFGADDPIVTDGIEFYDLDHNGDVVASIDQALVRAATA